MLDAVTLGLRFWSDDQPCPGKVAPSCGQVSYFLLLFAAFIGFAIIITIIIFVIIIILVHINTSYILYLCIWITKSKEWMEVEYSCGCGWWWWMVEKENKIRTVGFSSSESVVSRAIHSRFISRSSNVTLKARTFKFTPLHYYYCY